MTSPCCRRYILNLQFATVRWAIKQASKTTFTNGPSDDQLVTAALQVLLRTRKVLNRGGSVFALGARSPDDGGEEASALWRSHQHGSLVLVDDLNLVLERSKDLVWCCLLWGRCMPKKYARKRHSELTLPSYHLLFSVCPFSSLFQESVPQLTNCFNLISLMSRTWVELSTFLSLFLPVSRFPFATFHLIILVLIQVLKCEDLQHFLCFLSCKLTLFGFWTAG